MEKISIGGRVIMLDPITAGLVRKRQGMNRERDRRISRDLKQSGMLPGFRSGIPSANSGTFLQSNRELDSRVVYHQGKVEGIENRWAQHLQAAGL